MEVASEVIEEWRYDIKFLAKQDFMLNELRKRVEFIIAKPALVLKS